MVSVDEYYNDYINNVLFALWKDLLLRVTLQWHQCTALNGRMADEWWTGRDFEGMV